MAENQVPEKSFHFFFSLPEQEGTSFSSVSIKTKISLNDDTIFSSKKQEDSEMLEKRKLSLERKKMKSVGECSGKNSP